MAKKYLFKTYETGVAEHLDRHLEAAYNDGWYLRDNIRMVPTEACEVTYPVMYSVTLFKIVEEEGYPKALASAEEIIASQKTTTGANGYTCPTCGSSKINTWDRYIHDAHFQERVCADCYSVCPTVRVTDEPEDKE